jgi:hypothetical protein
MSTVKTTSKLLKEAIYSGSADIFNKNSQNKISTSKYANLVWASSK